MRDLDAIAASTLGRYPASTLPLSEVLELLRRAVPGAPLTPGVLLRMLEVFPERYRIIPFPGTLEGWLSSPRARQPDHPTDASLEQGDAAEYESSPLTALGGLMLREPWVVLLLPPEVQPSKGHRILRRSMVILGQAVDTRSPRELTRWMERVRAERSFACLDERDRSTMPPPDPRPPIEDRRRWRRPSPFGPPPGGSHSG